ncbi:MAG: RsmB/NOP family class I SAM-dependent RNA methyltransferase [Longimicrobiales bacterium]
MAGVTEGRRVAALILSAVSRGRRLDLAFGEAVGRLPLRDRRWVQEVTYGAVRFRGRLDYLLDLHLKKGLGSLAPAVLDLLRLGAYQLLFMDGVPPYAAISQTVGQVRAVAGGGVGRMANGVLRSLGREGGGVGRFPAFEADPVGHLSSWGSHPGWLVERWLRRWSPEEVQRLLVWNNTPPPLYLRPLGMTPGEAADRLSRQGVEVEIPGAGIPCLLVADGTNPARLLEAFPGIVQDPGAALVTVYADPPSDVLVYDLCAAPGGKALALAGEGIYVLAADRSLPRSRVMRQNLERAGGHVTLVVSDARRPPFSEGRFVLLDVPCSGTGTMRRHPDARWRLTPEMLEGLVELQAEILEAGSRLIPPGGHLVYSTCTLEEEENELQVEAFLDRNPEFSLEETGAVDPSFLDERGYLRVLPQEAGFDGAFAARLVKGS